MNLNTIIGYNIVTLRKERGMTQEQLAEALDISVKHCSAVERGVSRLSLEKLIEVSQLFDVSLDFLVKDKFSSAHHSTDYICDTFPPSIINVVRTGEEKELKLLNEYLSLYTKLRNS